MATNPAMTPQEAAAVLRDVGHYEERLTNRANGLTLMIWGLASAGIFLTYGTADPYLENMDLSWMYALLWLPWVAAGLLASRGVWSGHALTLRRSDEPGTGAMMGSVALFFVIAAGLFVGLDILAGIEWTVSSIMTIANGLFGIALATFISKWHRSCRDTATLVAGLAMVAVGIILGLSGVHPAAATLLGASTTGAGWFAAGLVNHRRG